MRTRVITVWFAAFLGVVCCLGPVSAQTQNNVQVHSLVLTIDSERLFLDSSFGKRLARELEAQGNALAAENRQIETSLMEEEQSLNVRRPTLPIAEFRALADAFDEKVQTIRREQDAKTRALGQRSEEIRRSFFQAARPVLGEMMQEAGAAVIIDRRSVFLSANVIDITDAAIARLDQVLGDDLSATPTPPESSE